MDFQKSCVSVTTKMSAFKWHFTCKDASDPFQRAVSGEADSLLMSVSRLSGGQCCSAVTGCFCVKLIVFFQAGA